MEIFAGILIYEKYLYSRVWKAGVATPGYENDCGGQKHVPEDSVSVLVQTLHATTVAVNEAPPTSGQSTPSNQPSSTSQLEESGIEVDFDASGPSSASGACSAPTWSSVVPKRLSEEVNENVFRVDDCSAEDKTSQRKGKTKADLLRLQQKKRKILNDPQYDDFPWSSKQCKGDLWQKQITQYQKDWMPPNVCENYNSWFNFIFNENNPRESTFNCRICSMMKSISNLRSSDVSLLANPNGVQLHDKDKNRDLMRKHEASYGHQKHLEDLEAIELQLGPEFLRDLLNDILDLKENPLNKPTSNVITVVFHEVRMNLSMEKHTYLMELLEIFKINVGYFDHCKSPYIGTEMLVVISNGIHKEIMASMIKLKMPLAITLDGSSDISNM